MSTCIYARTHTCLYFTVIRKIEGHNPCRVLGTKPVTKTEMKTPSFLCFLDLFPFLDCAPGKLLCVTFYILMSSGSWVGLHHQELRQIEAQEVGSHSAILLALIVLSPV